MTNSLIKDTTLETVVGYEEIPAIPYRPPQPARTVTERRNVCMFRYNVPGHYTWLTDDQTGQVSGMFVPDKPGSGLIGTYSCQIETVTVTYPAVPAQPYVPGHSVAVTSIGTGYNLGWNSGARSIKFFTGDGEVGFQVRESAVGVIAGMNVYDGIDTGYNGTTTDYAFICQHGLARIMRNGAVGLFVGAYTDATVFKITRVAGTVKWYVDGAEVFSLDDQDDTTAAWLEASLYSGTDEVFNPWVTQTSSPDLTAGSGDGSMVLAPATIFGADRSGYGDGGLMLSPVTIAGYAGLSTPAFGVGELAIPPASMSGTGLTGEIGGGGLALQPMEILAADHPYGAGGLVLAPLTMEGDAYEGSLNATMAELGAVDVQIESASFLAVTISSAGVITDVQIAEVTIPAELVSVGEASSSLDVQSVLGAVLSSLGISGDFLGVPESDSETWVVNLNTKGTTSYDNYGFNSFAFIDGKYYGAGTAGIFELEGDTDAGKPIAAFVDPGELDFGTSMLKTVSHAYFGMSAKGNLFVRMAAGGKTYTYKMEGFNPDRLRQERAVFGKGVKAGFHQFTIYNEDGADFELSTVEFHVAQLARRK